MELVSLYPYDPTARATSNKIENESITIIPPTQVTDYSYVIPRAAPFFTESLVVKDGKTLGSRTLVENVDYWCVIDFLSASVGLSKRVAVGIALLDPSYSGTLYVSYQTLGGNYTMADYSVLEELIRERYIVKHVSYEQIINLPGGFSPEWHNHEVADMVGMGPVVSSLDGIQLATAGRNGSFGQIEQQIINHVNSNVAHKPVDVGLGNVKNFTSATLTEAKNGTLSRYVTADIMKQYVTFEKQDLSGLLTKTDAINTYATKVDLGLYYTKSIGDGRYAYKGDTYTKLEVDNIITNLDISSSLVNYYNKNETDGKYVPKTDIVNYITTTAAAATYATKTTLATYYNKIESDNRYATQLNTYTRTESDNRFAAKTSLNLYLTETLSDSRYQQKSSMSNYYTKVDVDKAVITSGTMAVATTSDYSLSITEKRADNTSITTNIPINLSNHVKKSEVYTKLEVDGKLTNAGNSKIYKTSWTKLNGYRSYTALTSNWTMVYVPISGMVHITVQVISPFYVDENAIFTLTSGPSAIAGTGGSKAFSIFNWNSDVLFKHSALDYWVRRYSQNVVMTDNGNFNLEVQFGFDGEGTTWANNLEVTTSFLVTTKAENDRVMQWFSEANSWYPNY